MCVNQVSFRKAGFGLIETLVILAIAALLLGIGLPAFIDMISAGTATDYANDLLADINYARSEAVSRGSRVVICKGMATRENSDCTTGHWEDGWKIFEDCNNDQKVSASTCPDRNGDGAPDNEVVLRVHGPLNSGWTLRGNANVTNRITILPDARTNNIGTLVFCQNGKLNVGNQTRSAAVVVNITGRPRVSQDRNSDGIPDDVTTCNLN